MSKLFTEFASPERSGKKEIKALSLEVGQKLFNTPLLKKLLNSIPDIILLLNSNRQIVFANQAILPMANRRNTEDIYGMRPGEAIKCIHATENDAGCGTSKFCSECGAIKAILASQYGKSQKQDCHIYRRNNKSALDLSVWTSPINICDKSYVLCAINDIGYEKKKQVLERIFFHDILNISGALWSYAEILKDQAVSETKSEQIIERMHHIAKRLIDEIETQKQISGAENNDLEILRTKTQSLKIIEEIVSYYSQLDAAKSKTIKIDTNSQDCEITTDQGLLLRVLGNMLKNALEAEKTGKTITIGCTKINKKVRFWIHNPAFIPKNVQLQIFNRSFSTKGNGRGIGTYSIKLLTEKYLKGSVEFTSDKKKGTTFFVTI